MPTPLKLADHTHQKPPRRFNFTQRALAQVEPPDRGRIYVYDDKQAGLAVAITHTGHKAFYLCCKIKGRAVKMKLGDLAKLSIEQARNRVKDEGPKIAAGIDPMGNKREARAAMTLGELFNLYLEGYAKDHKRSWPKDELQYKQHLEPWANRPLDRVTRIDVTALHAKIGKKAPVAANRMLAMLSKVFSYAASTGYRGEHPCKGVKRFKEQARQRYLDATELPRFFRALKASDNALAKHAIWLMLLTAQRRETVLSMKWENIDLARRVWTIPQTKAGRSHAVPLSAIVIAILERQQRGSDSPFVLASTGPRGHYTDPIPALKRVCATAGITGRFTPHDLRRTWACWAVQAGVPHNVIQKALDHTPTDITSAVYAHVGIEQLREGFEKTSRLMLAQKPVKGKRDA